MKKFFFDPHYRWIYNALSCQWPVLLVDFSFLYGSKSCVTLIVSVVSELRSNIMPVSGDLIIEKKKESSVDMEMQKILWERQTDIGYMV